WALHRAAAVELDAHLHRHQPRLIVEAGSGQTTALLAGYAAHSGARVITLEHDPVYAGHTRALLARKNLTGYADLRLAPLPPPPRRCLRLLRHPPPRRHRLRPHRRPPRSHRPPRRPVRPPPPPRPRLGNLAGQRRPPRRTRMPHPLADPPRRPPPHHDHPPR